MEELLKERLKSLSLRELFFNAYLLPPILELLAMSVMLTPIWISFVSLKRSLMLLWKVGVTFLLSFDSRLKD